MSEFLAIGGTRVPIAAPSGADEEYQEVGGEMVRAFSGRLLSTVRARARVWRLQTIPLPDTEAQLLAAALTGGVPLACSGALIGGEVIAYARGVRTRPVPPASRLQRIVDFELHEADAPRPRLLFRWSASRPDSRLTTARSSPATYRDRTGILRTAGPGVLRLDWQDGRPYALVEPGATNGIRNPRGEGAVVGEIGAGGSLPTLWNSPAGQTGGLTFGVAAAGTEDGIPYVDIRAHGTPTSSGTLILVRPDDSGGSVEAQAGETWTLSAYLRLAAGSMDGVSAVRLGIAERTAGGGFLANHLGEPLGVTAVRLSAGRHAATWTLTDSDTQRLGSRITLDVTEGVPIDVTLRVGGPQLEPGSVATALTLPPEGTLAASARDRDLVSVPYAHAPGSCAVLTAGIEAGLGQVNAAYEWQVGASTNLDARSLGIRHTASAGMLRLWLGSGSARTESSVPVVPMGAEYQRLALLDVQDTEARVRLMQRHREGSGPWVDADGGWSTPLDVSELLAMGWEAPFLTVGNVREGTRAGRLMMSDLIALDIAGLDAERITIDDAVRLAL